MERAGIAMVKTWFITGTSSGFGRILTEQLLGRGDHVATAWRPPCAGWTRSTI